MDVKMWKSTGKKQKTKMKDFDILQEGV